MPDALANALEVVNEQISELEALRERTAAQIDALRELRERLASLPALGPPARPAEAPRPAPAQNGRVHVDKLRLTLEAEDEHLDVDGLVEGEGKGVTRKGVLVNPDAPRTPDAQDEAVRASRIPAIAARVAAEEPAAERVGQGRKRRSDAATKTTDHEARERIAAAVFEHGPQTSVELSGRTGEPGRRVAELVKGHPWFARGAGWNIELTTAGHQAARLLVGVAAEEDEDTD